MPTTPADWRSRRASSTPTAITTGRQRRATRRPLVNQGVTTIVVGQDGGMASTRGRLFARGSSGSRRRSTSDVRGSWRHSRWRDGEGLPARAATAAELRRMQALLETEMDAGAGPVHRSRYDPGSIQTRRKCSGSRKSPPRPAAVTPATSAARTATSGMRSMSSSQSAVTDAGARVSHQTRYARPCGVRPRN